MKFKRANQALEHPPLWTLRAVFHHNARLQLMFIIILLSQQGRIKLHSVLSIEESESIVTEELQKFKTLVCKNK